MDTCIYLTLLALWFGKLSVHINPKSYENAVLAKGTLMFISIILIAISIITFVILTLTKSI